jgi:RNA polymerase sigma-70 factor (ECF subfamily)
MITPDLREQILTVLPGLRAFALSLTRNNADADDLVQETLIRALNNLEQFRAGTNVDAWLFTILRNQHYTGFRKRRREIEDPDGVFAASLSVQADQEGPLHLGDFRSALAELPLEQQEALLLVGAEGFSYEEAAAICGIQVGTIKSRVHRGRARLAELLGWK